MKYYMTDENLIYILRLLKEKYSDMFISKSTYEFDMKKINEYIDDNNRLTKEELMFLEDLILERTGSRYEPALDDIPIIYLSGGFLPTTKDYTKLKMRYVSKTLEFDCYVNIKCQGTSSMAYEKKNFSIRTYEDEELSKKLKLDFKAWGEQYKFVLKANYIDLTHARNIVSARLWTKCVQSRSNFEELPQELKDSPKLGAIDGFFVKVYHEGLYQGRYTFNIPKDPWMTNMDEDNEQHCLLCSENYGSGCFREPAIIDESDWTDEIHDVVPQSIKTRWNEVIDFVRFSSDEDFRNNLGNYFDIESLIDYYCFQYMICGLDSMGKNQIYITYDGIKWFATSYDMDSTWGSYWDGTREVSTAYRMQKDYETGVNGTSNLLYDRLEKLFKQEIYDRYQILRNGPMSLSSVMEEFERFLGVCSQELINEDFDPYPRIPGKDYNNFKQIKRYAVDRYHYTDDCIEELITDTINANKLYSLPNQTTFNGRTSIDTGVKLFDTRKDWTLIMYGHMDRINQGQNIAIAHCMYEGDDGDYPGLSIQCTGYEEYKLMGTLDYFPAQGIKTNTFKIAITCENGIVSRLKKIENFGIESYKATSAGYTPVYKTLTLGSYQDENMNYGRHWNGTLYACEIYDKALTGGEINKVLNNLPAPNIIVRDNYTPNGAAFSDTVSIDWSRQELYATMNLESCSGGMQCILSFGLGIGSWAGNNVHFYYDKNNSGRLLVQCMIGGAAQNIELWNIYEQFTIMFSSEGLTINGVLYSTEMYPPFPYILDASEIQVGSTEGSGRSTASGYHIAIRSKSTF